MPNNIILPDIFAPSVRIVGITCDLTVRAFFFVVLHFSGSSWKNKCQLYVILPAIKTVILVTILHASK